MKHLSLCTAVTLLTCISSYSQSSSSFSKSTFTNEQLAEHLGLLGGNTAVEFDVPCYFGVRITDNTREPKVSKTIWSDQAALKHSFFYKHSANKVDFERFSRTTHEFHISSQNNHLSGLAGFTYAWCTDLNTLNVHLAPELYTLEKKQTICHIKKHDGSILFQLEFIFSTQNKSVEQDAAPNR